MRIHIPQSTALPSPPPYYSKLNIEQMNRYINNCCIIPASPHSSCFSRRKPAGPTTRLDFLASGPLWPGEDTRSSIPSLYVSHRLVRQDLRAELLLRKTGYSLRTGLQPRKALQRHSQDLDRVWRWTAGFNPAGDTIGASEFRKSLAYCHSLAFLLWQQILSQCTCASSPYSRTTGPPQKCF